MKKRKNHSADFKARVAVEAIREELTVCPRSSKALHSRADQATSKCCVVLQADLITNGGDYPFIRVGYTLARCPILPDHFRLYNARGAGSVPKNVSFRQARNILDAQPAFLGN
jgi:hypothetical protein